MTASTDKPDRFTLHRVNVTCQLVRLGRTQRDVGAILGEPEADFSGMMRGRKKVTREFAEALARVVGLRFDEVVLAPLASTSAQ